MWNIIKSQVYQSVRDNFMIYPIVIIPILIIIVMLADGGFAMTGGEYLICQVGENYLVTLIGCLILVTRVSAQDFNDKTLNYELLTGHSRLKIYGGRMITALIWGCGVCFLLAGVPVLVLSFANGWGQNVIFAEGMLRLILTWFPLFRLSCFFIMIATVMRNSFKGLIVGAVTLSATLVVSTLLEELLDIHLNFLLAFSNIMELSVVTNARDYLIDGETVSIVDASISGSTIAATVGISLLVGSLYLLIGYLSMRRADIG